MCGRSGCIETVASATGVVNLVNFYYPKLTFRSSILELIKENKVTAKAVFDAAKAGDQFCIFITEKVANYIGYLCSIISVTSNPKYIVLGGGMSTAGPILIENIKTEYHNLTFTPAQFETEIVQAKLGNDAGITGAAGLIKTYVLDKRSKIMAIVDVVVIPVGTEGPSVSKYIADIQKKLQEYKAMGKLIFN